MMPKRETHTTAHTEVTNPHVGRQKCKHHLLLELRTPVSEWTHTQTHEEDDSKRVSDTPHRHNVLRIPARHTPLTSLPQKQVAHRHRNPRSCPLPRTENTAQLANRAQQLPETHLPHRYTDMHRKHPHFESRLPKKSPIYTENSSKEAEKIIRHTMRPRGTTHSYTQTHVTEPREHSSLWSDTDTDTPWGHVPGAHTWTEPVHTQHSQRAPAGVLETPHAGHTQFTAQSLHTHTHARALVS